MNPMLIPAAIGAVGSLFGSLRSGNAAKKAANSQSDIAKQQAGLYGQSSPYYNLLLQAYGQHMGMPGAQMGPDGQMQMPTTLQQGFNQNPFENTADRLRIQQANTAIAGNYNNAANHASYGFGRRGLLNSNVGAAGHNQLLADASRQQGNFQQQLAINAPQEFERRLAMFANLLNPGLGAGPSAAGMYGNQANMYNQQSNQSGANLGSIAQNYMMMQAMRQGQPANGGNITDFTTLPGQPQIPGITTPAYTPPFVPQQPFMPGISLPQAPW